MAAESTASYPSRIASNAVNCSPSFLMISSMALDSKIMRRLRTSSKSPPLIFHRKKKLLRSLSIFDRLSVAPCQIGRASCRERVLISGEVGGDSNNRTDVDNRE